MQKNFLSKVVSVVLLVTFVSTLLPVQAFADATPTPAPTSTPVPTITPSLEPTATPTPEPTLAPTPTPSPIPNDIQKARYAAFEKAVTSKNSPEGVNTRTGNLLLTRSDLKLPGVNGFDFTLSRYYDLAESYDKEFGVTNNIFTLTVAHTSPYAIGRGWNLDLPRIQYFGDTILVNFGSTGTFEVDQLSAFPTSSAAPTPAGYPADAKKLLGSDAFDVAFSTTTGVTGASYGIYTKDGNRTYFDALGRIISTQDRFENKINYAYDVTSGKLVNIIDSANREINLSYSAVSVTVTVTDPSNNTTLGVITLPVAVGTSVPVPKVLSNEEKTVKYILEDDKLTSVITDKTIVEEYAYQEMDAYLSLESTTKNTSTDYCNHYLALAKSINQDDSATAYFYKLGTKYCGPTGYMEFPKVLTTYDYDASVKKVSPSNFQTFQYGVDKITYPEDPNENMSFVEYDGFVADTTASPLPDSFRFTTAIDDDTGDVISTPIPDSDAVDFSSTQEVNVKFDESVPAVYSVKLTCTSAADLMATSDTTYDDYMNSNCATTVTVRNLYNSQDVIASTTINPTTKKANIDGLPNGKYYFEVYRAGFLRRGFDVVILDANRNIGEKEIFFGDVFFGMRWFYIRG